MKYRLAILTSHPIQYQAPLFRYLELTQEIELLVIFKGGQQEGSTFFARDFGQRIEWGTPLLEGFCFIFLRNIFGISSLLHKERIEALIIYGWNSLFNTSAFISARRLGIPIIFYGENPLMHEFKRSWFRRFLKKIWLGFLFSQAAAFLYIGEENKKFYKFYGVLEEKLFFAPYAVDNERFTVKHKEQTAKRKEIREKLGISENAVVVLFVGKLIDKKRPFDLLKAYELLITSYQLPITPHLLFVGDGILRKDLEKYVEENNLKNVYFVGFKNQIELPAYYAAGDIMVLPSSVGETWGLVVNEAMCFGLPIIVSDEVGCGPDLVHHGENGYVFKMGDIDALANYIAELARNVSLRRSFGRESLRLIKSYNYEKDMQGILKALSK